MLILVHVAAPPNDNIFALGKEESAWQSIAAHRHCCSWNRFSSFSAPLSPLPSVHFPFPILLLPYSFFLPFSFFFLSSSLYFAPPSSSLSLLLPPPPARRTVINIFICLAINTGGGESKSILSIQDRIKFNVALYHSTIVFKEGNLCNHPLKSCRDICRKRELLGIM